MKASELRELSPGELAAKDEGLRSELFNLKVRHATGQLENTAKLKQLRRDIARVAAIVRERREAER